MSSTFPALSREYDLRGVATLLDATAIRQTPTLDGKNRKPQKDKGLESSKQTFAHPNLIKKLKA